MSSKNQQQTISPAWKARLLKIRSLPAGMRGLLNKMYSLYRHLGPRDPFHRGTGWCHARPPFCQLPVHLIQNLTRKYAMHYGHSRTECTIWQAYWVYYLTFTIYYSLEILLALKVDGGRERKMRGRGAREGGQRELEREKERERERERERGGGVE